MADMTPGNVASDAAAFTAPITADAATVAFLGAIPGDLATSVENLLATLGAAAAQVNATTPDAQLILTYPQRAETYQTATDTFLINYSNRFKTGVVTLPAVSYLGA